MPTHKLTHLERIQRAHIYFGQCKDWIAMSPVLMVGKVIIDPEVPTAATDGRDCVYGPQFLDKLTDPQVRFVVMHENMHKALLHCTRHNYLVDKYAAQFGESQAHQIVNAAQDFVINRDLMRDKTHMEPPPKEVIEICFDPKYDNDKVWDTVAIAEDIVKNAKKNGGGGKGMPSPMDGHKWGDDKGGQLTKEEIEAVGQQIKDAIRQGQILAKKLSANASRDFGEILEHQVDYKEVLREWLLNRCKGYDNSTWARPNRRYVGYGLYMPSSYSENLDTFGLFIDMSGSVGPKEVQEVLSEAAGAIRVLNPKKVDILYWDTQVVRHEHYEGDDVHNIMSSTKPTGGGGTSPSCVIPFCQAKNIRPDVAVWLSDGYVGGDWAEGLGVPAFWVITTNGAVPQHLPHAKLN